jgi:hypothetical protein
LHPARLHSGGFEQTDDPFDQRHHVMAAFDWRVAIAR